MLDALDTSMHCVNFLIVKLPPTSKGDVEDGRRITPTHGKDKP
jgi:hypothetical protein